MNEIVIEASPLWRAFGLREVWRYRELLYLFVWKDLRVRFKQTALGVAWIVLKPVLSLAIFTAVFGKLARIPSEGLPYSVFVLAALVPWNCFQTGLMAGSASIVSNAHLITKVYFPRLIIPAAAVLSGFVEAAISLALVLALMLSYGILPPLSTVVAVPLLFALVAALSLGLSLWLGALNVKYRDVGNAIPFFIQIGMYATPVVYPLGLVPTKYQWLVALNPMTGVVEGFRAALIGRPWPAAPVAVAALLAGLLLVTGLFFFRASERRFVDTV